MIRLSLLTLLLSALCVYSFKDWYKSLCGLIVLMAIIEHPDMPKSILGIQGLNPWNITLLFVCMGWLGARKRENLSFKNFPGGIAFLLIIYFILIIISFLRLIADQDEFQQWLTVTTGDDEGFASLLSEYIINCFKWVIPGILLFDGCRSRERVYWGSAALLLIYFLLAIQVIKWMPFSTITSGGSLEGRSLKILSNEVGYHRVNLAMMLSGGFWAIFCCRDLVPARKYRKYIYLACLIIFMGLALTGGRTGYASWAVIGGILIMIRWRKLLLFAPIPIIATILFVPAVMERLTAGFGGKNIDVNSSIESTRDTGSGQISWYTVTSGRSFAWPFVLEKIAERPVVGYGREAMIRTGVSRRLLSEYGESFPHPHNAYLQWIMDNGLTGFIPIIIFYTLMVIYSFRLFKDRNNSLASTVGGISLSLILALLVAAVGSQTFYPREGAVGMWCAMGLMFRVYLDRNGWVDQYSTNFKTDKNMVDIDRHQQKKVLPLWQRR